jgi:hypothetical protein
MPVKSYAVRLLIDEFDFSTDSNSLGMSFAAEELPASSFQVPAKQSIPTAGQNSLNHGGYYTGGTAGNMAEELRTRLASGIAAWVIVLFGTVTIPSVAYVRKGAWMGQLTMEAPIRELLTVQGSWLSIPTWRGLAIVDHDLEENHAGAFVDFKASGPDGGKIVIQTSVLSGGNVTVTVKSSTKSASWRSTSTKRSPATSPPTSPSNPAQPPLAFRSSSSLTASLVRYRRASCHIRHCKMSGLRTTL